ncbi:Glucan endo-1,3-alpha-glucosidase agn1 [Aspergillus melleus]|uniref:Glucan endo-1,3-alpha-glucosidase agn1 n=1 Tax=Aspergillus melleus TaxID=138277 RepID=A0ACC3AWF7_9EURO|nr:Glucan endo-1,3-alpha-glucosidase agn1 [Aspergillus melleus]
MMLLFSLLALLAFVCHAQAKGVFAHFMLGNSDNYTKDDWRQDISAAKAAHLDAFALNTGWGLNTKKLLDDAFSIADEVGFKLFLSLDYSGDGHWPQDQVVNVLKAYTNKTAYYRHRDDKPLVSTFEGSQAAGDWQNIKRNVDCVFIPDWSSLQPSVALGRAAVDGLMSWSAWPEGAHDTNTTQDQKYMDALDGKPYIMPISPWFYTNMDRYHKNWVWRGDDVWYKRWQDVLEIDPEYVEIISWNDYGESHYIGPIHERSLNVFDDAQAPFDYAKGMPHDGWRAFLPYVIEQYKNPGRDANVDNEGIVSWYRVNPSSACSDGKTTGNTETQAQKLYKPEEILQDKIFYSALLESPADITVSIGGNNKTATWDDKPDGSKGIYHGSIEVGKKLGDVVVTLSRDKQFLAQMKGKAITDKCEKNLTNWNAWVGNATSTGELAAKHSSSSSGDDEDSSSTRVAVGGLLQAAVLWTVIFSLA